MATATASQQLKPTTPGQGARYNSIYGLPLERADMLCLPNSTLGHLVISCSFRINLGPRFCQLCPTQRPLLVLVTVTRPVVRSIGSQGNTNWWFFSRDRESEGGGGVGTRLALAAKHPQLLLLLLAAPHNLTPAPSGTTSKISTKGLIMKFEKS